MSRRFRRSRWLVASGFAAGLMLGLGFLAGHIVGGRQAASEMELPLHALATHGTDTMAICTVPIDESAEGLATLDYLTGELRVFVMNPRGFKFTLGGKTNVLADLKLEKGKKVDLLMVCGQTQFIRGGAVAAPANSTLYVCDANTGAFVAYGMSYPGTALKAVAPAELVITKLDAGIARSLNLND